MRADEIIKQASELEPQDRYLIAENLIFSLSQPDLEAEKLWIVESQKRLEDYKQGRLETLSFADLFNK